MTGLAYALAHRSRCRVTAEQGGKLVSLCMYPASVRHETLYYNLYSPSGCPGRIAVASIRSVEVEP